MANKRPPRPAKRSMTHRMTSAIVFCLAAGLLAPFPARAQSAESPLCEVGSSVVDLMYFESTAADERIEPTTLRASIIFLEECPASVVRTIRIMGTRGPFPDQNHVSELRHAWIEAVRSAAGDSSNADVRGLLAASRARVARVGDPSLSKYLDGIFDGIAHSGGVDRRALEHSFERQALAALQDYAQCDGVECLDASDNVLFLLGTHPIAVFKAMRADSVDATKWLRVVTDDSFAGIPERGESREAARRAVLKMLSETWAPGFEPELRSCENRLREIRYRPVD